MDKDKKIKDEIIRELDLEIAKLQGALEEARRQRTVEHDYYRRINLNVTGPGPRGETIC